MNYVTFSFVTLRYVTLRYVTLPYVTSRESKQIYFSNELRMILFWFFEFVCTARNRTRNQRRIERWFPWFQGRKTKYSTCVFVLCREFRSLVIEIVLATDMSFHFQQIKNMKSMLSVPERWVSEVMVVCSVLPRNWSIERAYKCEVVDQRVVSFIRRERQKNEPANKQANEWTSLTNQQTNERSN